MRRHLTNAEKEPFRGRELRDGRWCSAGKNWNVRVEGYRWVLLEPTPKPPRALFVDGTGLVFSTTYDDKPKERMELLKMVERIDAD